MHQGLHRVIEIVPKARSTFSLCLERQGMAFIAGQCVNLGIPKTGINREYSSYSGENDPQLRFLIREVEGGQVTPRLRKLKPGDLVEVDGAYGQFVLPRPLPPGQKYCFIATGTGIAPFHSFVKSYPGIDYQIVHGVRTADEMYDRDDYGQGRYLACLSQGNGGDRRGRVTEYLQGEALSRDVLYYLCGNRNMINDVYDILRSQDISSSQIITEVFF